jgi:hypothetical protein
MDFFIFMKRINYLAEKGMRHISQAGRGLYAYALSPEGKIVLGKIVKREVREKFEYWELSLEGGTIIRGDYNQRFFCPSRGTWVKMKDLQPGKDTVYSLTKGPLQVLDQHRVRLAYFNVKAPLHRISVEEYENYFVSRDLILVHNFVPLAVPLGWVIAAHGADFVVAAGLAVVTGYVAEKVTERVLPHVQDAFRGSQKVGEGDTPAAPKIDTENKETRPPGPQGTPPDNGGPDLAKIPPLIAAEEGVRKNGGPALKAAGDAANNVVNTVKNALPGNNAVQAGLKIDADALTNPTHNDFNHIFGVKNGKWDKHQFAKIGKTASDIGNKLMDIIRNALAGGKLPQSGQYVIRDVVDGHSVEIRGKIVEGTIKIGTAFVDQSCC